MFEPGIASPLRGESPAVTPLGPISRAVLRCREADIDSVSERLRITLPRAACRSAHDHSLSALWLGPDEWLMMSTEQADGWANGLSARLDGLLCSLVDVSHRQVGLAVHGPRAEDLLATGCPLDLSIAAFPIGMCTRTMFAKAEVMLWRTGVASFHVEVWRSFARYVEALLREVESEA
jgi:sarcosine oxidase subunit gamma